MIFPTRAPAPQMRPSMGYAAGSNAFGYVAHMGYLPGTSTLGAISATMQSNALAGGVAQSDLDLLNSLGATDNDIQDLLNGTITLSALYAQYGVNVSPPPAPAVSAAPPQSPPGSTLLYTASYNPVKGWTTAAAAIQALAPLLPAHGMALQNSQISSSGLVSNASFSITILDSIGHNLISDAQSVLDALMNQISNNGLQSSSLTMVSPGTAASGAAPGATTPSGTDLTTWLENNALYIGLGIAGLVVLQSFMGKRR